MDRGDPLGQRRIVASPLRPIAGAVGVVGGTGDLKQLTRTLDVPVVLTFSASTNGYTFTGLPGEENRLGFNRSRWAVSGDERVFWGVLRLFVGWGGQGATDRGRCRWSARPRVLIGER
jgi:hypothetical protein